MSIQEEIRDEVLALAGKLFAEKMYFAVSVGDAIDAALQRNIQLIDYPKSKGVIDNATFQEIVETILYEVLKRYWVANENEAS